MHPVNNISKTLRELRLGRLAVPLHMDPATWVLGGGRLERANTDQSLKFEKLCQTYLDAIPAGAKAVTSLKTEKTHIKHLQRILGPRTPAQTIRVSEVQSYVNTRSKAGVSATTIQKELVTFAQIWKYARSNGVVQHDIDKRSLRLPKKSPKLRFHTMQEAARAEKNADPETLKQIYDSIYLNSKEVIQLLEHVQETARHPWIYPAFSFAAFCGVRRSEIVLAAVRDVDLENGRIEVREKKRVRSMEYSFRTVNIAPRFSEVLTEWLAVKPESPLLICNERGEPITVHMMTHHWKQAMEGSKWEILKGWHVLRHSFASICESRGVREATISAWMGHATEEMRARYRHLFPEKMEKEMSEANLLGLRYWRLLWSRKVAKRWKLTTAFHGEFSTPVRSVWWRSANMCSHSLWPSRCAVPGTLRTP